ncbi:hypothetical protein E2C01_058307 [Portunus trituberculatus]|uniref:Uncharacterized protein n=1 Tax=Portunus trituberculatus TaxID=210409 RepID=A0A5B7H2U0_PORTR|nr:hypothetical protein [Portunus trituberculatus]
MNDLAYKLEQQDKHASSQWMQKGNPLALKQSCHLPLQDQDQQRGKLEADGYPTPTPGATCDSPVIQQVGYIIHLSLNVTMASLPLQNIEYLLTFLTKLDYPPAPRVKDKNMGGRASPLLGEKHNLIMWLSLLQTDLYRNVQVAHLPS